MGPDGRWQKEEPKAGRMAAQGCVAQQSPKPMPRGPSPRLTVLLLLSQNASFLNNGPCISVLHEACKFHSWSGPVLTVFCMFVRNLRLASDAWTSTKALRLLIYPVRQDTHVKRAHKTPFRVVHVCEHIKDGLWLKFPRARRHQMVYWL